MNCFSLLGSQLEASIIQTVIGQDGRGHLTNWAGWGQGTLEVKYGLTSSVRQELVKKNLCLVETLPNTTVTESFIE